MPLYSEPIEVECTGELSVPSSFTWREREFRIEAILSSWQDAGFAAGSPRRKTWRLRHHRNYFAIRTEDKRKFEIYLYRKGPTPTWVLYREIET